MFVKQEQEKDVLYVKMFGKFSMEWNGKDLLEGVKASDSQFSSLMQVLIHARGASVSRGELEQILFDERDINDIHHAVRCVVYNARKKLERAGLPGGECIGQKSGGYYWTERIPVCEDAAVFENCCNTASAENEPDKEMILCQEACRRYTGEFLPSQAGIVWASQEAVRYRKLFGDCMDRAVLLLRERQDFAGMEALGRYAAGVQPLADWETVTMEALTASGQYDKAHKLYENTVNMYFQKQGLRPSRKMTETFYRLGARMDDQYGILDEIQLKLAEAENSDGGYLCAYPIFEGIYRAAIRVAERRNWTASLMLCTVIDGKGNPMKDGQTLEKLSSRLEEAVCASVHCNDVVTQYRKGQLLVLLFDTDMEGCKEIEKQINSRFIIGYQRSRIKYQVANVF